MPHPENASCEDGDCPSLLEEHWVSDEREGVATAARAEERLFRQMGAAAVGVSSYRMKACCRGRILS